MGITFYYKVLIATRVKLHTFMERQRRHFGPDPNVAKRRRQFCEERS